MRTAAVDGNRTDESDTEGKRREPILSPASVMQTAVEEGNESNRERTGRRRTMSSAEAERTSRDRTDRSVMTSAEEGKEDTKGHEGTR